MGVFNKMLQLELLTIVSFVYCIRQAIGDCHDLTFDFCGTDQTIPFETFTDRGEEICQQICREVYPVPSTTPVPTTTPTTDPTTMSTETTTTDPTNTTTEVTTADPTTTTDATTIAP